MVVLKNPELGRRGNVVGCITAGQGAVGRGMGCAVAAVGGGGGEAGDGGGPPPAAVAAPAQFAPSVVRYVNILMSQHKYGHGRWITHVHQARSAHCRHHATTSYYLVYPRVASSPVHWVCR